MRYCNPRFLREVMKATLQKMAMLLLGMIASVGAAHSGGDSKWIWEQQLRLALRIEAVDLVNYGSLLHAVKVDKSSCTEEVGAYRMKCKSSVSLGYSTIFIDMSALAPDDQISDLAFSIKPLDDRAVRSSAIQDFANWEKFGGLYGELGARPEYPVCASAYRKAVDSKYWLTATIFMRVEKGACVDLIKELSVRVTRI